MLLFAAVELAHLNGASDSRRIASARTSRLTIQDGGSSLSCAPMQPESSC